MNLEGQKRSPSAAERMRRYRKQRRDGMRYIRIPLHESDIAALTSAGLLSEDQRQDAEALQAAVLGLVYGVADGHIVIKWPARSSRGKP
jgi:hypothetical protein